MAKMGTKISKAVLTGTMLCIDPSSGSGSQADASNCGYALFKEGRRVDSGIIKMDHKIQSWYRLRELVKALERDFEPVNLLIVEQLTGPQIHQVLHQAVGAIYGGLDFDNVYEMSIPTWQALSKKLGGWRKSDEADAKYMGYAAICLAMGYEYCRSTVDTNPQNVTNKLALTVVNDLQDNGL